MACPTASVELVWGDHDGSVSGYAGASCACRRDRAPGCLDAVAVSTNF
ncbi:MAG: hypothetical protein HC910_14735 [Spirulinaceae cyanobacterium SM2_1_0]|nr:hypothetical protein [Spirulinaceae cyanobacterium SM2_1_0]